MKAKTLMGNLLPAGRSGQVSRNAVPRLLKIYFDQFSSPKHKPKLCFQIIISFKLRDPAGLFIKR